MLSTFKEDDLKEIDVKKGDRIKIMRAIPQMVKPEPPKVPVNKIF